MLHDLGAETPLCGGFELRLRAGVYSGSGEVSIAYVIGLGEVRRRLFLEHFEKFNGKCRNLQLGELGELWLPHEMRFGRERETEGSSTGARRYGFDVNIFSTYTLVQMLEYRREKALGNIYSSQIQRTKSVLWRGGA